MNKTISNRFNAINNLLIQKVHLIFCILSAIIIITICSKSSPLYPLNDWGDSNCFFTVGKSIFKGLVPYRDLIEHKGPLLYFLHAFASLISYKTFFGVYLIEIVAASFFLYISYKILELFCGKNAYLIIPLLAYVVFRSKAFCHGDSAEELCFPFLSFTLYIGLKSVRNHTFLSLKESFLIGLFASCVFWTKFILCGIYVGWFIPYAIYSIINKQYKNLLNTILYIILGLIAGTIPWIIYFGINHAIIDWLKVYLYYNIFLYSEMETDTNFLIGIFHSLFNGFRTIITYYRLGLLLLGIGGIYCYLRKWFIELVFTASMLFSAFFFMYIGGVTLTYYTLIITPFVCLGLVPVYSVISAENEKNKILSYKTCWAYLILIIYTYFCAPNNYLMHYKKEDMPQFQFAEIISQIPDATLLNYDFLDGGFYITTGIVPNCKTFCGTNLDIEELQNLQIKYIQNGLCDFVVTKNEGLDDVDINNLYEEVACSEIYFEEAIREYHLFKLRQ